MVFNRALVVLTKLFQALIFFTAQENFARSEIIKMGVWFVISHSKDSIARSKRIVANVAYF